MSKYSVKTYKSCTLKMSAFIHVNHASVKFKKSLKTTVEAMKMRFHPIFNEDSIKERRNKNDEKRDKRYRELILEI